MFTSDALQVFKTKTALARAAGVTTQAVSQWKELVPPVSAAKLAAASGGKLKFDPSLYETWNKRRAG